jgi:hypothetical protein
VGDFDKITIQEESAKTGRSEGIFSTVKPTSIRKFCASPVKYCSKPLKSVLKVHKTNNVTPLDDLLHLPNEN